MSLACARSVILTGTNPLTHFQDGVGWLQCRDHGCRQGQYRVDLNVHPPEKVRLWVLKPLYVTVIACQCPTGCYR